MARTKANQFFIQGAIKHPGTFHAYCARQGHKKVNASCIAEGLQSLNSVTRQRANLARNLARLRPK